MARPLARPAPGAVRRRHREGALSIHAFTARHGRKIQIVVLVLVLGALLLTGGRAWRALQALMDGGGTPAGGTHWLLRWIESYGLPLAFGVMVVAAAGVPLPVNLLLLTLGAAAAEGRQSPWLVAAVSLAALVAGDHLGYGIGWWGGRWLVRRMARFLGSDEQLTRARETVQQRGWLAVFLTRWLLLPLGSPCNWVCGSMGYPLRRFSVADLLGEAVYVAIFLLLGIAFSEQIEDVAQVVGAVGLWLVGLLVAGFLAWRLFRGAHQAEGETAKQG